MKLLFGALALLLAVPAAAQSADAVDKRVGRLESEMKAVQRKVFPGGDARYFEPEIAPAAPAPAEPQGTPASAPLTDLTARVGELEGQLRTLTGQVEANQNKLRQLDEALTKFRGDAEFRIGALEGGARPPSAAAVSDAATPATATPTGKPPRTAQKSIAADPVPSPATSPPASPDAQWKVAYALVQAKAWDDAESALTDFLAAHPKSPRASDAQYWLGKTYAGKKAPAQAAKAYLDGYQKYPKGTRAPDSLLGLSQALIDLKKPEQACRSLNELDAVYGEKLSPALKDTAAKARVTAKCKA